MRALFRPEHLPVTMCLRVPGSPEQPGTLHDPVGSPDQCLRIQQVLYLPLSILAWIVAFLTSNWEQPAEVQMGCGVHSDMKWDLNCWREGKLLTSSLNFMFHQLRTCCFAWYLKISVFGVLSKDWKRIRHGVFHTDFAYLEEPRTFSYQVTCQDLITMPVQYVWWS